LKITISKASSYDDIVKFFEILVSTPVIPGSQGAGVSPTNLDSDLAELSYVQYKQDINSLTDNVKGKSYYDGDDGVIAEISGKFYQKDRDTKLDPATGKFKHGVAKFNEIGGSNIIGPSNITDIDEIKTGDYRDTISLIVNLKKIPDIGNDTIKDLLKDLKEKAGVSISGPLLDVVYFNIYKNQLKIVLGVPEGIAKANIDALRSNIETKRSNIFTGEFEQQDDSRNIIFTTLRTQEGGAQNDIKRPIFDQTDSGPDSFYGRASTIYDSEQTPKDDRDYFDSSFKYRYKKGSAYKIPYSINEKQLDSFMDELGSSENLNPLKLASNNDIYKKFRIENRTQIDNYISQYKNIKELVLDSNSNNSQLKNMIEFLNDPAKKTLYDFNQQVMKKNMPITGGNKNNGVITITVKGHGLHEGVMVTINGSKTELDNRSFEIIEVDTNDPDKFSIIADGSAPTSGTINAYSDDYDIHSMNILPTKFEEENDGYSPKHVQMYLNRCYELEKLYIIKHHEFLFMKNIFDKSFIFYLMTFIVFFYYVKTLGRIEKKSCNDTQLKLPKTFLGDIELMVKNQNVMLNNINDPKGSFKILKQLGNETEGPNFTLSGGSRQRGGRGRGRQGSGATNQASVDLSKKLLNNVPNSILAWPQILTFIAETESEYDELSLQSIHTKLKQNKDPTYDAAREYLNLLSKSKSKEDKKQYVDKTYLNKFLEGVCVSDTIISSRSPALQLACKDKITLNVDKELKKLVSELKEKNLSQASISILSRELDKIQPLNDDNTVLEKNIKQILGGRGTFKEKQDEINKLYNLDKGTAISKVVLNKDRSDIINLILEDKRNKSLPEADKSKIKASEDNGLIVFTIEKKGSIEKIKISKDELIKFMNVKVTIPTTGADGEIKPPTLMYEKPDIDDKIMSAHKSLFYAELNSKVELLKKKDTIDIIFKSLIKLDEMVNENSFLVPATPASTESDKILKSYKYYYDLIKKNIFNIKDEVINAKIFDLPENKAKYSVHYVQNITQPEIADLINSLTTQTVSDCLTNMVDIITKIKDKMEAVSKIDKYFDDDSSEADKANFYKLLNDFFEPNFKLVSIFGSGNDEEQKKDNLFETKTPKKKNLMIALLNSYYGNDKGEINNKIVKDITTDDDNELGQKMLNMYKNYMEFRRLTCAFNPEDGGEQLVTNQPEQGKPNYSKESDQPKYTTLINQDKLGSVKDTIQPMGPPNPKKISRSNYLSKQIISEFQKEHENGGGKEIFDIFNKYYFQEVTKFEFTLYHYDIINKIFKDEQDAPADIDEEGLSCKGDAKFLITEGDQTALKAFTVKDEEKRSVDGVDISINGLMSTFNEKMMGAARVYTLIRDTADKKKPPFLYYKPLPKIKYDGKIVEKILLENGIELNYRSKDVTELKTKFIDETNYNIHIVDTEKPIPAAGLEIKNLLAFVENGDSSRIQLTTGGGPGGRIIKNPSDMDNDGNDDKKQFIKFLEEKIERFESDHDKNKSEKTEAILKYRAIGDLFLHPISEAPEKEGEITGGTQTFDSTCVFMPNKNFLGIGDDSAFRPYTCSDEWTDGQFGKVYGPFRKTAFHSIPAKLYNQEFKDISKDIEDGSAAVFFGYGFSGSGKTYTLTNSDDGFLKTIVADLKNKSKTITKVYIKELYPYFPNHLEPEVVKELDINYKKDPNTPKDASGQYILCQPNNARMREQTTKYESKTKTADKECLGTDEEVLKYIAGNAELYSTNDNPLSEEKNIYPFVEIDYLTITSVGVNAANMKVLGDSDGDRVGDNTIPKLDAINTNPDTELPKLIDIVAKIRKQLLQVSATPNNPDSSRSHLYIQLEFVGDGSLTIVDMAGAENTIQIQVQFLIGEKKAGNPAFTSGENLKLTPRLKDSTWLEVARAANTQITMGTAAYTIWQPNGVSNNQDKKYGYDLDGYETTIEGKDKDWRKHADAQKITVSNFFELIYKSIGKDTLGNMTCATLKSKALEGGVYICGIPANKIMGDTIETILTSLHGKNKFVGRGNYVNIPFIQRFIHYGEKCGSNGSSYKNLINTFMVFTIYDIALALNYRPIGITNLYQEWKTGNLYKDTNEINADSLPLLIETFEGKIWTSMWKRGYVKGEDKVDTSFDEDKFETEAEKTSIKDEKGQGDNLNYNRIFEKYTSGNETYKKECELILKKVLVQLDLDYLIDPSTILTSPAEKKYTDPDGSEAGSEDACIIYSPFVWLYYRCKEIIGDDDLIKRILILKIIFQYINLIVDQGKGIVTSLEHLKYFFLYNTNQQEGLYAYNFKQADPKVRFIHNSPIPPPDFEKWIDNDPDNSADHIKVANQNSGYNNSDYIPCNLLTDSSKYKRPVKLDIDGGTKTIIEEVNKGNIDRFKMLQNLVYFGKICSKSNSNECKITNNEIELTNSLLFNNYKSKPLSQLKKYPYIRFIKDKEDKDGSKKYKENKLAKENEEGIEFTLGGSKKTKKYTLGYESFNVLDINKGFDEVGSVQKDNTYIMMAHIMRGTFDSDGYVKESDRGKYCDATKATLEFAESIKSDVGICQPVKTAIIDNNKNRWDYSASVNDANCDNIYNISSTNPEEVVKKLQSGGNGTMVCSYTSPANTNKIYELSLPSYLRNNNRNMAVHTMVDMLTNKIKSKKNIGSISNRLRSKRRRNSKSPSRLFSNYYKN
jgi:hypothetical protein